MQRKYEYFKNKYQIYWIICWFLLEIVFVFSIVEIGLSNSANISNFYDVGSVYEFSMTQFRKNVVTEGGHQKEDGEITLDNGNFQYWLWVNDNDSKYKYLCIDIEELSVDSVSCYLNYGINDNGIIKANDVIIAEVKEGMNLLEVVNNSFNVIGIRLEGDNGISLKIKSVQLRENEPVFSVERVIDISMFLIFSIRKLKIEFKVYNWLELIQGIYEVFARGVKGAFGHIRYSEKKKSIFRIFLFFLMFLYNIIVDMRGDYYTHFKYHLVVYGIIIILIAAVSGGERISHKNWNNPLVWSWIVLWIISCISDFFISKEFRYVGYFMFVVTGFFFFVWGNMQNRESILQDFAKAVQIGIWIMLVFCLFFKQEISGVRYVGISPNPSVFGLQLGLMWAVTLCELENGLRFHRKWKYIFLIVLESCVVIVFAWKSQSMGPLLCMVMLAFIWLVRAINYARLEKKIRRVVIIVASSLILLIPTYILISLGIKYLPGKIGTAITYTNEKSIQKTVYGETAHAAELIEKIENSRIGQKLAQNSVSALLSERNYYYKAYLRDMNLLGHQKRPKLWGKRRLPHNALLGIAHRYGVLAFVPYVMMLIAVIIRTAKCSGKKKEYVSLPFYCCLIAIAMSMSDNVEQPFVWLPNIALYLLMGYVFGEGEESLQSY